MELRLLAAAELGGPPSLSLTSTIRSTKVPSFYPQSPILAPLLVKAAKRNLETYRNGLLKNPDKDLPRILRKDAAIGNIERKSKSTKYNNLSPKPVLEALSEAISENRWESALKIFGLLRRQFWYEPKTETYTKLLMMLGKCRQPEQASLLYETMSCDRVKPTIDVYTALVSAYGLCGLLDKALSVIHHVKSISDCKPDAYMYSMFINCCIKLHRFDLVDDILVEMSYVGIKCNTVTYNTIIDGYGKAGMFELMESTLINMIESCESLPDICTLNSITWAYGNGRDIEKMEKRFDEFRHMGVSPDVRTFNILIRSYGKAGMFEKMESVLGFMKKRSFSPSIVTFNVIIEAFGKAGNIRNMEEHFKRMKYQGFKPNSVTYCSLVSAYGKSGNLQKIGSILRQVENSDVTPDTPFFNAVISAYGQAGDIERMRERFLDMKIKDCKPDNITFATMIQAYNAQGMLEAAQELELEMSNQIDSSNV